jgi:DnaJ-class molecular chaperone
MAAKQQDSAPGSSSPAHPVDPIDLQESVAGEEDPGASVDFGTLRGTEGRSDQPAGQAPGQPSRAQAATSPGDEAPVGTPGTGENVCPRCGGTGRLGASACPECGGTGKVNVGIGGA